MNRRHFLKFSGASMMATSMLQLGQALANTDAQDEDYKALVCVFLYGGMDNHDTLIPYDTDSYNTWASHRSSLLSQYTTKRTIANLNPINTPSRFGTRSFALAPELSGMANLYQQGKLAIVGNVGPLVEPISAEMV